MSIFALFIDWLPLLHLEITLTDSTTKYVLEKTEFYQLYKFHGSKLIQPKFSFGVDYLIELEFFREIAKVENTEWRKREAVLGYVMIEVISLI